MTAQIATLLQGLAAVLWPLVALVVVYRFSPAILDIIQSARSRKFTLKIGGQELSMEEATRLQGSLIADLQLEVGHVKESLGHSNSVTTEPARTEASTERAVLWVDDQPKNNSYFVDQLTRGGIRVDYAVSTAEGLELFSKKSYRAVISDLGRLEHGHYSPDAGLGLLRAIKQQNPQAPFAFFTGYKAVDKYRDQALQLGAGPITSSGVDLATWLRGHFPDWRGE
jgi:CheY-like chemotaxis protein